MAPKPAKEAAKKKAAKQKKILIVLGLVLVGALVFAVTTLSHLRSAPVSVTPVSATTPDGASTPTGTPIAAVIPGIAAPPAGSLRAFTAFGRKDPFNDDGPDLSSSEQSTPAKHPAPSPSRSKPKPPSGPLTSAVISINRIKLTIPLGAKFGHASDPSGASVFKLVKVSAKTAVVAVLGASQRFTLHVRQPLTLVRTGAWKFTLILEPVGTKAPKAGT